MRISLAQAREVASLARLELSEQELASLNEQLNAIVSYVEQLNELDTDQVEGTSHVVSLVCPGRADEQTPSPDGRAILERAPQVGEESFFMVPKVIS
jgi:aspartyl-tRNA(Asn)/glutamyl-tRNA(Gln) amidotransferase subunit C